MSFASAAPQMQPSEVDGMQPSVSSDSMLHVQPEAVTVRTVGAAAPPQPVRKAVKRINLRMLVELTPSPFYCK